MSHPASIGDPDYRAFVAYKNSKLTEKEKVAELQIKVEVLQRQVEVFIDYIGAVSNVRAPNS